MTVTTRTIKQPLATRDENNQPIIAGYVILFNDRTELAPGVFEEIEPQAIPEDELKKDIRALINHETGQVLGRTTNNTLKLEKNSKGIYATIYINTNDGEAMNLYHRVQRGDVNQASFGFVILKEDYRENTFFIQALELHEVSVVTFPAYKNTMLTARQTQTLVDVQKRKIKEELKKCLEH